MKNFAQFIKSLGGLHDAVLIRSTWYADDRLLDIIVDDIYSNNLGLDGYEGPKKATLRFTKITRLYFNVELNEQGLMIYDWNFTPCDSGYISDILFSPSGKIHVDCNDIECIM